MSFLQVVDPVACFRTAAVPATGHRVATTRQGPAGRGNREPQSVVVLVANLPRHRYE